MIHLLYQKQKDKSETEKKGISNSFFFIFLSLVLLLLAFFIYLVHHSNFEKVKIDAMRTSLHSSFSASGGEFRIARPSFEANQINIYYQDLIGKMFPGSSIVQDIPNDKIALSFEAAQIFTPGTDEFKPTASVFFKRVQSLLNASFVKNRYQTQIILFEDLPVSENYPVFENLTSQRVNAFLNKLQRIGLENAAIYVGVQKGNASKIILLFRPKEDV